MRVWLQYNQDVSLNRDQNIASQKLLKPLLPLTLRYFCDIILKQ